MVTSIIPRKGKDVWDIWEINFIEGEIMVIKKREERREGEEGKGIQQCLTSTRDQ
jgi:hypothetical protein